jgi:hypothetical protein
VRILFVAKYGTFEENIRNGLSDISEKDSIVILNSYNEAETFLENGIHSMQDKLDIIICENNIDNLRATELLKYILADSNKTYSNFDFNLNAIPIVLLADANESRIPYRNFSFSTILERRNTDEIFKYVPDIASEVRHWRRNVLNELDNLGILDNSGVVDYSYYLSANRLRDIQTKILSDNFKAIPRKLKYQWFEVNEQEIEIAIDQFIKEIKRAERLDKKHDEKRFHQLINKFPFLIKRDNYSKHIYEPRLHYENDRYHEPDFTLIPNFNQRTDLSVLEIKLPNEGFIKKTQFHPSPYSKLMNHLFQVNDYKDYLESDDYRKTIIKVFGFAPTSIEFNILIGRRRNMEIDRELLAVRMRQINQSFINLITYDDLVDYQVRFLKRMKILKIN